LYHRYAAALEGSLIGRGDVKAVNAAFTAAGVVCASSLWHYRRAGGMTLVRVWYIILTYYLIITVGLSYRWLTLNRARRSRSTAAAA
jgi:hypothetical protein